MDVDAIDGDCAMLARRAARRNYKVISADRLRVAVLIRHRNRVWVGE